MSHEPLSEREREILRLVAIGATNQRIANELSISINTVKVHVRNIFAKIGAGSRAEAALHATRIGLVAIGEVTASQTKPDGTDHSFGDADAAVAITLDRDAHTSERLRSRRTVFAGAMAVALVLILAAALGQTALGSIGLRPETATPGTVAEVQRWRVLANLPTPRAAFAVASLSVEGKPFVYVIGGDDGSKVLNEVIRYDPTADLWVSLSAKPTPVTDARAAVVGNKIYVVGGKLPTGQPTERVEAYDPQRDRWTSLSAMPAARTGHAVAAVEGKLYVIGGWDGSRFSSDVWQYNPDDDTWRARTPMPTPRGYTAAAVIDGRVHVLGGENESGLLAVNERYWPADEDGSDRPWSTKAPLPVPAARADAVASGGYLLMAGLQNPGKELAIYTPTSDSWRASAVPLGSIKDLRLQSIGTKLYIVGGRNSQEAFAGVYEYQVMSTIFLPVVQ